MTLPPPASLISTPPALPSPGLFLGYLNFIPLAPSALRTISIKEKFIFINNFNNRKMKKVKIFLSRKKCVFRVVVREVKLLLRDVE